MPRQLNTDDYLFETFWAHYPRKENKATARKKFTGVGITQALLETMIQWLERACRSDQWQDRRFIPHASTWLHQRRWEDDPPPIGKDLAGLQVGSNGDNGEVDREALNQAVTSYHERERKAQERAAKEHADAILAKPAGLRTTFERQWLEMWRKQT